MTESTQLLTSAQAAARLGVKQATLYAYVSRGVLTRHRSSDGRTSLFDADDVARLAKRSGRGRSAPSDVTVASELTLVDQATGTLAYRGLDVSAVYRTTRFEQIAWWLWTGSFDRVDRWRSVSVPSSSDIPGLDRITLAAADAVTHDGWGPSTGADVMGALVAAVTGRTPGHSANDLFMRFADRTPTREEVASLDAALVVLADGGLDNSALVARLVAASGGGIASSVSAALQAALPLVRPLAGVARSVSEAHTGDAREAVDRLSSQEIETVTSHGPFRREDPRTAILLQLAAETSPDAAATVDRYASALTDRVGDAPNARFALAALTFAHGMDPDAAPTLWIVARAAGWIGHALEETRRPTPYRPRLAYTGPPLTRIKPRRALDAVTDYLSKP